MPPGKAEQPAAEREDELIQLRAELREFRSILFELVRLLRAHIANVALFNQEHVRAHVMDRLEELSKRDSDENP